MHFLITGHTGFKGAWLAMLLKATGNEVSGISLAPEKSSIFNLANLDETHRLPIERKAEA